MEAALPARSRTGRGAVGCRRPGRGEHCSLTAHLCEALAGTRRHGEKDERENGRYDLPAIAERGLAGGLQRVKKEADDDRGPGGTRMGAAGDDGRAWCRHSAG